MNSIPDSPIRVLFLCTENAARSQIAEALLQRRGGSRFVAASAGTRPGDAIHPGVVQALAAVGIHWRGRPKSVAELALDEWDLVITLCDKAKEDCPSLPNRTVYAHWTTPDPKLGSGESSNRAFSDVVGLLAWRIDLMLLIPFDQMASLVTEHALAEIANRTPGAASPPTSR